MIKNNLNIAQQVNCSGISSSLFLFFDSKICKVSTPWVSPKVRGQDFPEHVTLWSLPGTDGDGKTLGTSFTSPMFVAKRYHMQGGRDMRRFSLPTKSFSIIKEKQKKGNAQPSPQPSRTGWSTQKERRKLRVATLSLLQIKSGCLKPMSCISGLDWLSEEVFTMWVTISEIKPFTSKP